MAGALATTKARYYPALPPQLFPEFFDRIAVYHGHLMTSIAVELSLLAFVRSGELCFARWDIKLADAVQTLTVLKSIKQLLTAK